MTFEIMMPFYGRIDHFKIAVTSILLQDDPDWKLTVIDDVYPDLEPGIWLEGLKDSRITYIRNTENLRPSRNYNKSANLSTSTFMTIMGCDDVMLPAYVSTVKSLISQFPDSDIIQPGVEVIDEMGQSSKPISDRMKKFISPRISSPTTFSGEAIATSLLKGNWTYFPSLVWRTSLIREYGFRTDLDVVQDLAMLFKIIANGGNLLVDDKIVFQYRRHSSSVSSVTGTDGSKFRQERTLFEEASQISQQRGWNKAASAAKHHWLSRANALRELPGAIINNNSQGKSTLTRHVLRLPYKEVI